MKTLVYEEIFLTNNGDIPTLPNNKWKVGEPVAPWASAGRTDNLTETNNTLWQSVRAVEGDPPKGSRITKQWKEPVIISRLRTFGTVDVNYTGKTKQLAVA